MRSLTKSSTKVQFTTARQQALPPKVAQRLLVARLTREPAATAATAVATARGDDAGELRTAVVEGRELEGDRGFTVWRADAVQSPIETCAAAESTGGTHAALPPHLSARPRRRSCGGSQPRIWPPAALRASGVMRNLRGEGRYRGGTGAVRGGQYSAVRWCDTEPCGRSSGRAHAWVWHAPTPPHHTSLTHASLAPTCV